MLEIPSTIPEQIDIMKDLEISYRTLHTKGILIDKYSGRVIRIPFQSLTNKYRNYLSRAVETYEFNYQEQLEYAYKPKLLSENLYGTTEFWSDLLMLNNCFSVYMFHPKKVKIYNPSKFKELLNEILILEGVFE